MHSRFDTAVLMSIAMSADISQHAELREMLTYYAEGEAITVTAVANTSQR